MSDQDRLLKELEDCRWFVMGQLADECEENGRPVEALGWRWMAANHRWPKMRVKKGKNRKTGEEEDRLYYWFNGFHWDAAKEVSWFYGRKPTDTDRLPDWATRQMEFTGNKDLKKLMDEAAKAVGEWVNYYHIRIGKTEKVGGG